MDSFQEESVLSHSHCPSVFWRRMPYICVVWIPHDGMLYFYL